MAKRRYTRREMEKIYRRRRILVSFIAVLIVVLIGYTVYGVVKLVTGGNGDKKVTDQQEQTQAADEGKEPATQSSDTNETINITDNKEEEKETQVAGSVSDWNLILANPDTPLPDDFKVETAIVQGSMEVDTRIVDIAKGMIDDAKKEDIDLLVCSGYRSIEKQQNLFDNSINGYIAQGYSKEEAIKFTKAYYAIPGTSEHHTGLAMDIVTPSYQTLDDKYAETDAAKWLLENAYKYGFVLRYEKDKEDITKIAYEPWHYRYVGEEHAKIMKEKNLCFEEYLKTL